LFIGRLGTEEHLRGTDRSNYLKAALGMLTMPRVNPLSMTSENKVMVAFNLSFLFGWTELLHAAVNDLIGWVEAGAIEPPRVRCFRLADMAEAHRALESGEVMGKLVLRTASPLVTCDPPR
jgi:synaptic vesicle membrane protein VAT-1